LAHSFAFVLGPGLALGFEPGLEISVELGHEPGLALGLELDPELGLAIGLTLFHRTN